MSKYWSDTDGEIPIRNKSRVETTDNVMVLEVKSVSDSNSIFAQCLDRYLEDAPAPKRLRLTPQIQPSGDVPDT